MKETLKKVTQRLGADKKLLPAVAAGVIGILLLLASEFLPRSKPRDNTAQTTQLVQTGGSSDTEKQLEQRLKEMISSIDGAGRTTVMVTFEDKGETVYARNSSSSAETDAQGAKNSEQHEYVLTGGGEAGIPLKNVYPSVRGVAVICEGGDLTQVRQAVLDTVSAVLGISRADVSVAKMDSDK